MKDERRALVLFSGGQDSTVCLAWALNRFRQVETIGFDYGQRHEVELECRQKVREELRTQFPKWGKRLGDDHLLDLALLGQISDTALTQQREIEMTESGLPNTFVPGRNLLFLTFAATVAYRRGLNVLVGGMCETDFSGYPDCRDNTLKAFERFDLVAEHTHTCYVGDRSRRHEWGYGCGLCPACDLRRAGYNAWMHA